MQLRDVAAAETSALEAALSASFDKLLRAASTDAEKQIAAARAEAKKAVDAAVAEQTTLAGALEEEKRRRAQAEKQVKEHSAAQAFADAARREAEAARDKEAAAREEEATQRASAERDLASARDETRERDREHARALKQAESTLKQAETARKEAEAAVKHAEAAQQEAEKTHAEQLRAEKNRVAKSALQPLDHLRAAFDRYRGVETIDDVLQILLESMATEFARVAVFDVNAHRLEVSRHTGFDGHDMSKVVVPLTMQSPLTRAVKDGKVQGLTARELTETTRALVGGSPAFVLVLPVPIRGQVRAVIYADDSGHAQAEGSSPERRVRFAEILLWHTVPLLTRLALDEEAMAEFREYAASIVNDLESVYSADAGKHKANDLRKRLQLNLQYAKRRFAERMQSEGAAAGRLLDEQLAAAIERKGETPFGKDLAAVAS